MGNKAGYSDVILDALGLRSGSGADSYLWAEADDDVRALLRAYPDAAMLRRIAEIIRGWADEEPRALWERLRAERKARRPVGDVAVAGWIIEGMWSYRQGDIGSGGPVLPGERRQDTSAAAAAAACKNLANYAAIVSGNRLVNMGGEALMNTGDGGTRFGGEDFATAAVDVAAGFEALAGDLAGFALTGAWAMRRGEPDSGYTESRTDTGIGEGHGDGAATIAHRIERAASRWPPVAVLSAIPTAADVSRWLGTPGDLSGCVIYMDPPYVGTTGYGSNLTRDEVIAAALDFDALGAVVCISEAEPVIGTWYATAITAGRRGQKRTFSRQQNEYLTINRPPAAVVATQVGLFGPPRNPTA